MTVTGPCQAPGSRYQARSADTFTHANRHDTVKIRISAPAGTRFAVVRVKQTGRTCRLGVRERRARLRSFC